MNKFFACFFVCIVFISISGCENEDSVQPKTQAQHETQAMSTIRDIREPYYEEGIRHLEFYTSTDYIMRCVNTFFVSHDAQQINNERIKDIRSVMSKFEGRAQGEPELLFARILTDLVESSPMVAAMMVVRDNPDSPASSVQYTTRKIDSFFVAVENVKEAKNINDLLEIDFESLVAPELW